MQLDVEIFGSWHVGYHGRSEHSFVGGLMCVVEASMRGIAARRHMLPSDEYSCRDSMQSNHVLKRITTNP